MRILVCRNRRAREPEAIEELVTALLQEGHRVREAGPDRASRRFDPELVVARYLPGHIACAWFARRRRLPFCLLVDTSPRRPAPLLERMVWRTSDRVLAANGTFKDEITALGVDPARIEVVPGGVVPGRFLPAPFAPNRASDTVVLGWIGDTTPAASGSKSPGVALTVIGEAVPPARVPDLLAGVDIALLPAPAPLRLIDCMAAGRAIVAPDRPEVRELLEHERTALLFDPAEEGALLRAAARLVADALLRARLGEAARAEITQRDLSWRSLARRLTGAEVTPPL